MSRQLDTKTLDAAAKIWAGHFNLPSRFSNKNSETAVGGREWVMQNFYRADFKDEFEYLLPKFKGLLGGESLAEFEADAAERFIPRCSDKFAELLADKLAIDMDGNHIPGKVGCVVVGQTKVGTRVTRHGKMDARWPEYAGEKEERAAGNVRERGKVGKGVDPLPPEDTFWFDEQAHMGISELYTLVTNVSLAFAQAGIDASVALLDEGSVAGFVQGWTGAQPVDPNAADVGTLLFSLTLTTPSPFGASTDAAPGALATAASIADDTAADATGTVVYCRGSSSNALFTVLNSHVDGHADTSGGDFNFNTTAIVSGATVSMTSWTITQPQGPTAT